MRCLHEAQLHEDNMFLTLTYDDEHLPYGGTLVKKDFQDFMKRYRKRLGGAPLQYFHCGEYGDEKRRPHYHALLFGHQFVDAKFHRSTPRGDRVFTSEQLSELWGKGFCTIGAVTFESAAYVARYVVKKVTGNKAALHYTVVDADGEIHELLPEYTTMSLKRPIGKGWFQQFASDCYPSDEVIVRGKRMKPPKFYDKLYELENPEGMARIKSEREAFARAHEQDSTPQRLAVREHVKLAQIRTLKRNVE